MSGLAATVDDVRIGAIVFTPEDKVARIQYKYSQRNVSVDIEQATHAVYVVYPVDADEGIGAPRRHPSQLVCR